MSRAPHVCDCSNNDDGHLCDDPEHGCETCFREEAAYWARYFDLDRCKTREERRAALGRFDHYAPRGAR